MNFRYPTTEQISTDPKHEEAAISTAITALTEALDGCPLPNHMRVYALLEMAFKLEKPEYIRDVLNEIAFVKATKS